MKTTLVLLALTLSVACATDKNAEVVDTTAFAVVHQRADASMTFNADDVDAAFAAITVQPVGHDIDHAGTSISIAQLQALPKPDVYIVDDLSTMCGKADVYDGQDEAGCYVAGTDTTVARIVVRIKTQDEVGGLDFKDCSAVRLRLAHFVGHYAQEALGLAVDHSNPLFGSVPGGFDADLLTQRWYYRTVCEDMSLPQ